MTAERPAGDWPWFVGAGVVGGVGAEEGALVVGDAVVGEWLVGDADVGCFVGAWLGALLGDLLGDLLGALLGDLLGLLLVGDADVGEWLVGEGVASASCTALPANNASTRTNKANTRMLLLLIGKRPL